jgi:hypothetical protein
MRIARRTLSKGRRIRAIVSTNLCLARTFPQVSDQCGVGASRLRKPMLYPLSHEGGEDLRIPGWAYRGVAGRPSGYVHVPGGWPRRVYRYGSRRGSDGSNSNPRASSDVRERPCALLRIISEVEPTRRTQTAKIAPQDQLQQNTRGCTASRVLAGMAQQDRLRPPSTNHDPCLRASR